MIELVELTKRYGQRLAVDGLSLTVRPGTVTGFLGPNGAGKSTTMRLIVGLEQPTRGTALINGKPYAALKRPLSEVGALLEAKAFHPGRKACHHLRWIAAAADVPAKRIDEVLELVGLTSAARRRAGAFSLGMAQRLGLAAALLAEPQVLILDEPANGLDPEGVNWIRQFMRGYAESGRTVLVSSHLLSEMAETADHLVVIGKGKLIADLPTQDFIRTATKRQVRVRAPEAGRLADLIRLADQQVERDEDGSLLVSGMEAAEVGRLAAQHAIELHELSPQTGSLEEAFLNVTQGASEYNTSPAHTDVTTAGVAGGNQS
ncbi:ATP-binding cassette domain-containing protein [Streptosporangium algeriense]|uniref:ATP-binding cassette domain-containing protein n=1 Tax=Streptosporangium algeriense TaxID=1682748 RepID=A0ABW3DMG0_9ACTN